MRSQTLRFGTVRTVRTVAAPAVLAVALALPAAAQMGPQVPPERAYDAERVGTYVAHLRTLMADRHGDLADAYFRLSDDLAMTPNGLNARPAAPVVAEHTPAVSAEDLFRYQTSEGGSLGRMHGTAAHASGFAWFPHSMYAQGGRKYAQWGFARLLRTVRWYAEGQATD